MAKKSSVEKQKRRERLVKLKWNKRQELRDKASNITFNVKKKEKRRASL